MALDCAETRERHCWSRNHLMARLRREHASLAEAGTEAVSGPEALRALRTQYATIPFAIRVVHNQLRRKALIASSCMAHRRKSLHRQKAPRDGTSLPTKHP